MSWLDRIFGRPSSLELDEVTRLQMPERRRKSTPSTGTAATKILNPAHSRRRSDRAARRDLLQAVVREALADLGVLSLHYKFKVMSVDQEGTQFVVLVDLSLAFSADIPLLKKMEMAIIHRALSQRQLTINAVFWRRTNTIERKPTNVAGHSQYGDLR
jgi:hypothetical protein